MRINSALKEQIELQGLPVDGVFLFLVSIKFLGEEAVSRLLDSGMLTPEEETAARILFVTTDFDTGELICKPELFEVENTSFRRFLDRLATEHGFTSKGHPRNQIQKYAPINNTEETTLKFMSLVNTITVKSGSFDEDRLLQVTVDYYFKVESPKNLANYFQTQAEIDYYANSSPVYTLS